MRPRIPNSFLTGPELADRLRRELLRDEAPGPADELIDCRFRRCGGRGDRETGRRWPARIKLTLGAKVWYVCEGCADLLIRDRPGGTVVRREPLR